MLKILRMKVNCFYALGFFALALEFLVTDILDSLGSISSDINSTLDDVLLVVALSPKRGSPGLEFDSI